jgi:hypothetical protein
MIISVTVCGYSTEQFISVTACGYSTEQFSYAYVLYRINPEMCSEYKEMCGRLLVTYW